MVLLWMCLREPGEVFEVAAIVALREMVQGCRGRRATSARESRGAGRGRVGDLQRGNREGLDGNSAKFCFEFIASQVQQTFRRNTSIGSTCLGDSQGISGSFGAHQRYSPTLFIGSA